MKSKFPISNFQFPLKNLFLILLLAAIILPTAVQALSTREIEGKLMCICKDKCGKVLADCTCGTSDIYRKEIRAMLSEGKKDQDVVAHYVKRFGEKVLSAPTKTGFNLTAWIVPFLALFAGGWGINKIVQSWVRKRKSAPAIPKEEAEKNKATDKEDPYKKLMDEELKDFDE